MCKVNKHNRIKTLLKNIVKIDPSLEDECKDFLVGIKGNAKIDSTFPPYLQVIYEIYGPNYPANEINVDKIRTLIDNISNSKIQELLYQRLYEKESNELETANKKSKNKRDSNEARLIANNELMNNLNSINNIKSQRK